MLNFTFGQHPPTSQFKKICQIYSHQQNLIKIYVLTNIIYRNKIQMRVSLIVLLYLLAVLFVMKIEFMDAVQAQDKATVKPMDGYQQEIIGMGKAKRVILLVVDASKYVYSEEFDIITKLLHEKQDNSLLMKCIVSEPTMTTQKIQTLMTGSEVFSTASILDSFFSSPVSTDNLILQLHHSTGSSVSMGDDTWGKLFRLSRQYPCTSTFDIWDWETCDQVIYRNLENEMKNTDNQIIIAHFLVLDHIGHSTSSTDDPNFSIMKTRLSEYFEQIIANMREGDILMITGDHGMRNDGNHGGSSPEQTQTFLFIHSPHSKISTLLDSRFPIKQPDITTTISILLNIPTPYNSIGLPIFIPQPSKTKYQHIAQYIFKHFSHLIASTQIQCPLLTGSNSQNITYTFLKDIQSQCLSKLAHSSANLLFVLPCICFMAVFCFFLASKIGIGLKESVIFGMIGIPHSFSWLLIRNSSTYYLICLIILVIVSNQSFRNKTMQILAILSLSQLQPTKPGDFQPNILLQPILQNFLKSLQFQLLILLPITYLLFIRFNSLLQQSKIISLLSCITILAQIIKIILPGSPFIIYCNIIGVTFSILCIILHLLLYSESSVNLENSRHCQIGFIIVCLLAAFNNSSYVLIVGLYCMILCRPICPYIAYILSQYCWWVLGNRYQYSSFDIKQSYAFSQSYHHVLNPICLIINSMTPFLLAILLQYIQLQEQEHPHQIRLHEKQDQSEELDRQYRKQTVTPAEKHFGKYIIIPMVWLIFCLLNLLHNQGKILFTVVYVPMTIIQTAKIILFLTLFILLASF